MPLSDTTCLTLIGIAGAGKSTLAPILARRLGWEWIDTDRLIEATHGERLQAIMDAVGAAEFLRIEEEAVVGLAAQRMVVSTGGSVVYSEKAMQRLKLLGPIVFLDVRLDVFERRVGAAKGRAFVCTEGKRPGDVWSERRPLYQAHADITVCTDASEPEECAAEIIRRLSELPPR
jgi:shikimate kinase